MFLAVWGKQIKMELLAHNKDTDTKKTDKEAENGKNVQNIS